MATPKRPTVARLASRVPGGFDTDEDLSPIKTSFDHDESEYHEAPGQAQTTSVIRSHPGDESLNAPSDDGRSMMAGEGDTFLQEKEMRMRLEDVDSTFLPEVSPAAQIRADDSADFSQSRPNSYAAATAQQANEEDYKQSMNPFREDQDTMTQSPATPPELYQTPAPGREELQARNLPDTEVDHGHYNTSSLETMSSSPTAAAAARTVSRAVSMASMDGGYETADDSKGGIALERSSPGAETDDHPTPRKARLVSASSSRASSPTPTKPLEPQQNKENKEVTGDLSSVRSRSRPQYLNSRVASQRFSYSSHTTTSTEGGSEVTVGADFALQSGGAVPQGSLSSRPSNVSRTISLGSMASGISDLSDHEDRIRPTDRDLHTLDEEDDTAREDTLEAEGNDHGVPQTPRATSRNINTPTDTVIAQHVRDIEVPATLAREYRDRHRQPSPEKRNAAPTPSTRGGKSLTLKEQSSTIDRLMKENWDLKLKINFLDDALSRRSDEGVKAMISENVDLRTAKFKSAKEMRELKRTNRELERKLQDQMDELAKKVEVPIPEKVETGPSSEDFQFLENELTYFRERVMTYEVEVEKMRHEGFSQEREKKRLAEMLKRASESNGGADIGVHEEVVSIQASRRRFGVLMQAHVGHVEGPSRC